MGDENNDHEKRSSTWTIQEEILSAIKKTKNKYAIFEEEEYDEEIELRLLKDRMIVDNYINKSIQPTCSETQNWSKDMISYFKQKWEEKEVMKEVFEDVMEGENVSAKMCSANEISGLETAFCAALKLTLNLLSSEASNRCFGGWDWVSNSVHSQNSCRIVIGWDRNVVNLMILHMSRQTIFYLIESVDKNIKLYCNFIYAANCGIERRVLWNEIRTATNVVADKPWIMLGDFNVTMKADEHSSGSSLLTNDMQEFIECVTDEFLPTVEKEWKKDVKGYAMYKVVKKLKTLKHPMKKLSWKNGDLTARVDLCRENLRVWQKEMVQNPHDSSIKMKEAEWNLVADQFVQHFQKFLGPNENGTELQTIKDAMFDIGENRAPGPDGFTSAFYKHSWSIVGKDICQAIRDFFNTGKLLGELNATLITLIPKINNPIKVSDYRPIACCNVLYKCISKIITNRIKSGLDKLVNVNQSAFVPGRVIQEII
ncbi:RNA-directed DNA polymerase, eukaryota, reverse transcriptase zinc-binding domain protein [Tanacetum coccineum]